jgi:ABC-type transport system involved in multi-copper enzyme maturation permease subunit
MFLAVQVVHGAIEDRTVQYLFLRPVSRMALLLGNLFAVAVVGAGFGGLAMAALFGVFAGRASLWPDGVDGRLLWVYLEGCVWSALAYAAVGTLFSVFFRRPLVAASFFVVGLQMLTANLPVSAGLRQLTITDPVRRLVLDGIEPDSVLAARLWPAERSFRMDELGQPRLDLAWFVGVMAVLALLYYRRTEYDARHRE